MYAFRRHTYLVLIVLLALNVRVAQAQDYSDPVPRIEEAESYFQQALESFEQGEYGMAHRRFRAVYSTFPLNRKTTAAELMAGKALYRSGEYRQAIEHLSEFAQEYSTSGYIDEAHRVIDLAQAALVAEAEADEVIDLGIALPLREQDAAITQVIFNGIRLAVEEHNSDPEAAPIRMIFRNSGGTGASAGEAVRSLVEEGADVMVGPLYSDEAAQAAAAAEEAGVVLLAPLATDEAAFEDKQFVFQANPSITMRGRQMARFAIETLELNNLGIIAERDVQGLSERMAEGFQDEALRRGADVEFFALLPSERGWVRLPEEVGPVQMEAISAVYMPIVGLNARVLERAALAGLDSMKVLDSLNVGLRVLGNSEWHGLRAAEDASRYGVTYTHDFFPDEVDPDVQSFLHDYEQLAGERPAGGDRRLAFTGYDVARYLIENVTAAEGQPLWQVLRDAPFYQGLGIRILFDGGNTNEALYYLRYQDGRSVLLR